MTDAQNEELAAAIAEAELTDEEAAQARELVAQGGQVAAVIPFLLAERDRIDGEDDEPVTQAAPGASEPTAKQLAALEKELIRHEKRVREVMGEFAAGMDTCDKCGGIGLAEPSEPEPELQQHSFFRACDVCGGYGIVATGSRRPGEATRNCPDCAGRGYLEAMRDGQPLAGATTPPPAQPAPIAEDAALANGATSPSEPTFGVPAWMGDPSLAS